MDKNNKNEIIVRMVASKNEMIPMVAEGIVELGANPREAITVKAWAPGKPPGGKLPADSKPQNKKKE